MVGALGCVPCAGVLAPLARRLGVAYGERGIEEVLVAQQLLLHGSVLHDVGPYAVGHPLRDQRGKIPDGQHLHIDQLSVGVQLVVGVIVQRVSPDVDALGAEGTRAVVPVRAKQAGQRLLVAAAGHDVYARVLRPAVFVRGLPHRVLRGHHAEELLCGPFLLLRVGHPAPHVVHQVHMDDAAEPCLHDDMRAPHVDERVDGHNVVVFILQQVHHRVPEALREHILLQRVELEQVGPSQVLVGE